MTHKDKTTPKRSRGRPALRTESETRAVIIQAARTEFLAHGYAGTGIEAVAQRAAVSTRTIYSTVASKAELFRFVIGDAIESSIAQLSQRFDSDSAEDALFALVRSYADLVLGPEGVLTARAMLAEQTQFPELRESYLASINQVAVTFDRRLKMLCHEMSPAEPVGAGDDAALLRSMINGAQRSAILDPDHVVTISQVSAWADRCTRFYLKAHGVAGPSSRSDVTVAGFEN